jgi:hypothetical protein
MTAAAHQHGDEPFDREEEPMPAADFQAIERAHAICDHAATVDLTVEKAQRDDGCQCPPSLEQVATKILRSQIRARELVAEMQERGEFDHVVIEPKALSDFGDDEMDEPTDDWAQIAADAWNAAGWAEAAHEFARMR